MVLKNGFYEMVARQPAMANSGKIDKCASESNKVVLLVVMSLAEDIKMLNCFRAMFV